MSATVGKIVLMESVARKSYHRQNNGKMKQFKLILSNIQKLIRVNFKLVVMKRFSSFNQSLKLE